MAFYAGYVCKEWPNCEVVVISKDTGFDCIERLAKSFGCSFKRLYDLTGCNANNEKEKLLEDIELSIKNIEYDGDKTEIIKFIAEKIQTLKTKNAINNNIQKYLKNSKKASEFAKALRPLLKDKT